MTIATRSREQYEESAKEKEPNIGVFNPNEQTVMHEQKKEKNRRNRREKA